MKPTDQLTDKSTNGWMDEKQDVEWRSWLTLAYQQSKQTVSKIKQGH